MQRVWTKSADDIAYELQGTCVSLYNILERYDMEDAELDQAFTDRLDSLVFECRCCEWWFEISEMTDDEAHDWMCDECARDQ